MNRPSLRVLTLLVALPLSGWFVASSMAPARAQDPKPAPEGKGEPREGGERGGRRGGPRGGPSLHGAMEQMGNEFERLTVSIVDPAQNEATLQSLGRMIAAAGASQSGEPKTLAKLAPEAQVAQKAEFRRALATLARDLAEIELLVLDGKNADASTALKSKVAAAAELNHEKFHVDEDHDEPRPPKPGEGPK